MDNNIPFIHLFETILGKYFYDVNTDEVVEVSEPVYYYLKNGEISINNFQVETEVKSLIKRGYLKSKKVQETEHPLTKMVPYFLKSKVNFLELQVTQNCNLRCEYCAYSGGYYNRQHAKKNEPYLDW